MNITYIVGNGLDLQYGLKTKYKDFYEYQNKIYIEKRENDNYSNFIYESLFDDKVNNYENWSDFEFSIGKLTKENADIISNEESKEKFIDDFADITDDLRNYLKTIQEGFDCESEAIDFETTLDNMVSDLPNVDQTKITKKFNEFTYEDDNVNILSLNYTNILDKLYEKSNIKFYNRIRNNYEFNILKPIHTHETLDACTILGVSDTTQLSDDFNEEQRESLVKELSLVAYRENMDARNRKVIETSDIIILYGVSLGDTDRYLWNQVATRSINASVPIIIYHYVPNFDAGNPIRVKRQYKKVEAQFIKSSGIDSEFEKQLRENLIIVIGKSIFELNNIEE